MARQYKAAGRQVFCGMVHAKINDKGYKRRYLKATCGSVENEPAKLHLFKDVESVARGISSLLDISFAKVDYVKADPKESITIKFEGKMFSFYADSNADQKMWMEYCFLLNSIPNHSIPEEPKYAHKNKFANKYEDNANIWVVFIVDNGVGHDREFRGLHIIDFSTKDQDDSNFRVLNVYTEKCQHTWNKSELRICGRIGSLVYVEVVRLGLLWMYCPNSSASEVSQHLHKFLYDHTSTDDDNTRSLDSGICCSDSPKGSPELTDSSAQLCNHITSNLTCLSSNSQRSPLTHNLDRSSFDDDLERSLSFGDDSDAYYTANSDENDDALLDSGYFQPNQLQDLHNCTAGINTRHVSNNLTTSSPISSPMNIHSGVTCCRNSSYCSYHAHYNSHSCKGSCQLESMHMKHRLVADISPGLSSPALLGMNERSKKILDCRCQYNSSNATSETEERQKKALEKNYPVLIEKIDIGALLPHLIAMDLLTDEDKEILMNVAKTRTDKIHHLIDVLPRKAFGWFNNFLECLQRSSSGTGHADIIKMLSITYELLNNHEE